MTLLLFRLAEVDFGLFFEEAYPLIGLEFRYRKCKNLTLLEYAQKYNKYKVERVLQDNF